MMDVRSDSRRCHHTASDLTGGASLVEMERWPIPMVVRYLVVGEAMEARARWDRMQAGRP